MMVSSMSSQVCTPTPFPLALSKCAIQTYLHHPYIYDAWEAKGMSGHRCSPASRLSSYMELYIMCIGVGERCV